MKDQIEPRYETISFPKHKYKTAILGKGKR